MSEGQGPDSPAGSPVQAARSRFLLSLKKKATELEAPVKALRQDAASIRSMDEFRRRLHALYAAAQVFRVEKLALLIKQNIDRVDRARLPVSRDDLAAWDELTRTLHRWAMEAETGSTEVVIDDTTAAPILSVPGQPVPPNERASDGPSDRTHVMPLKAGRPVRDVRPVVELSPSNPPVRTSAPPSTGLAADQVGLPPTQAAALSVALPSSAGTLEAGDRQERQRRLSLRDLGERAHVERLRNFDVVIGIMVIDNVETQARARALLSHERFEVTGANNAEEGLRIARATAPDVVLVDAAILADRKVRFADRLFDDRLTERPSLIAVFGAGENVDQLFARSLGADDALRRPLEATELLKAIARTTGVVDAERPHLSGDLSLGELVARIGSEFQHALVDSSVLGRDLVVPLQEGTEITAAVWSAISRIRAIVAHQSGGRVRFRDAPDAPQHLVFDTQDGAPEVQVPVGDISLRGRLVMVVDDDPTIVWFFSGLLREAGADALEAHDGQEALELAQRRTPDVVLSDILMPRLDGYGLSNAFRRDVVLHTVPVIFLSWKDDLLQRMRELSSGAAAYLQKDAGSMHILDSVRGSLRNRATLEAELKAGGEVNGRIESFGVLGLLRAVTALRPDASLTMRSARSMFEVEIRNRKLVSVTRTATDGGFARGAKALGPLVGTSAARFTVKDGDGPARANIAGDPDALIADIVAEMRRHTALLTGSKLFRVTGVELDADVVDAVRRQSPGLVTTLLDRLTAGETPKQMILSGVASMADLESVLLDLVRQSAVLSVSSDLPLDEPIERPTHVKTMPSGPRTDTALGMPAPQSLESRPRSTSHRAIDRLVQIGDGTAGQSVEHELVSEGNSVLPLRASQIEELTEMSAVRPPQPPGPKPRSAGEPARAVDTSASGELILPLVEPLVSASDGRAQLAPPVLTARMTDSSRVPKAPPSSSQTVTGAEEKSSAVRTVAILALCLVLGMVGAVAWARFGPRTQVGPSRNQNTDLPTVAHVTPPAVTHERATPPAEVVSSADPVREETSAITLPEVFGQPSRLPPEPGHAVLELAPSGRPYRAHIGGVVYSVGQGSVAVHVSPGVQPIEFLDPSVVRYVPATENQPWRVTRP